MKFDWTKNGYSNPTSLATEWKKSLSISLGGYAGTGKTTLIAALKKFSNSKRKNKHCFCSYTGRAAQNLKNRLKTLGVLESKDTISTIHGLIYDPIESKNGWLSVGRWKMSWKKTSLLLMRRQWLMPIFGVICVPTTFQLSPLGIMDSCRQFRQFQLNGKTRCGVNRNSSPSKENPITLVATYARESGKIPVRNFGEKCGNTIGKIQKLKQSVENCCQIILSKLWCCAVLTLRELRSINLFRTELGFEDPLPKSGDRVICLRNNHAKGIYNGMLGTVVHLRKADKDWYEAEIDMDDSEKAYSGLIYAPQFGAQAAINFTKGSAARLQGWLIRLWLCADCAQGSGWPNKTVILFEERSQHMTDDMWRRWLYTAVTRAEEELFIFG